MTDCPKCDHPDVCERPSWSGDTSPTNAIITCPKCGHQFTFDWETASYDAVTDDWSDGYFYPVDVDS